MSQIFWRRICNWSSKWQYQFLRAVLIIFHILFLQARFWTWTIIRGEDTSSLNFLSIVQQPDFFNHSANCQLYTLPPSILTSVKVFRAFSNYLQLKCLLLKYPCRSSPSCITRCMQFFFLLSAPIQRVAFHNFPKIIFKKPKNSEKQGWGISGSLSIVTLQGMQIHQLILLTCFTRCEKEWELGIKCSERLKILFILDNKRQFLKTVLPN